MNRTFISEDCAEDELRQRAIDDVTGVQGYFDDERSCFWTRDNNEYAWQSRPFKGRQVMRRKGKGKGKGKSGFKRAGRAFFGEGQAQDPEWWSEEDFAWGSKGKKGKIGLSKGNEGFQNGGFRTYQPEKGAGKEFIQHEGKGNDQKKKGEGRRLSSIWTFSLRTPSEQEYGHA